MYAIFVNILIEQIWKVMANANFQKVPIIFLLRFLPESAMYSMLYWQIVNKFNFLSLFQRNK